MESPEFKELMKSVHVGRKQSEEEIANRIAKTNQIAKEAKRKATMLERFGVDNYGHTSDHKEQMSALIKGRSYPRVDGQQENIIRAKRKNGTLNHTEKTKRKLSKSLRAYFSNPNVDRSVYVSKVFNSCSGYFRGLYYRSSYEYMFLRFCRRYYIDVLSAENTEFAVPYIDGVGKRRVYYPDFYLPEFDLVVEIKPQSMLDFGENPRKFKAARNKFPRFEVLTELIGYTVKSMWSDVYTDQVLENWCSEYLCYQ